MTAIPGKRASAAALNEARLPFLLGKLCEQGMQARTTKHPRKPIPGKPRSQLTPSSQQELSPSVINGDCHTVLSFPVAAPMQADPQFKYSPF